MWSIVSIQQYINTVLKIMLVILSRRGDDLTFKYWTWSKKSRIEVYTLHILYREYYAEEYIRL